MPLITLAIVFFLEISHLLPRTCCGGGHSSENLSLNKMMSGDVSCLFVFWEPQEEMWRSLSQLLRMKCEWSGSQSFTLRVKLAPVCWLLLPGDDDDSPLSHSLIGLKVVEWIQNSAPSNHRVKRINQPSGLIN